MPLPPPVTTATLSASLVIPIPRAHAPLKAPAALAVDLERAKHRATVEVRSLADDLVATRWKLERRRHAYSEFSSRGLDRPRSHVERSQVCSGQPELDQHGVPVAVRDRNDFVAL